jgi:nicotinamide mononucleotide transporter
MDLFEEISWLEWFAFITSLLYTWLAAKENIWCWLFGGLGAAATMILCIKGLLYSDVILQIYYIAMAIYGWLQWNKQGSTTKPVLRMNPSLHFKILLIGGMGLFALGAFWKIWGAALPFIDAGVTSFSILATWLIARKYLENWIYFIVIDTVSIFLFASREMYLLAFLFIIYTFLATYGYFQWRRIWQKQLKVETSN